MLLKDFAPAYDVREFVQLYRIVHLQFLHNEPVPFKAYPPRPEQCLAFYPFDTETVSYTRSNKIVKNIPAVLYGQFTQVTNRNIGRNFLVFQILFNPGALYRLTAMPAAILNNEYIDAAAVFKGDISYVNEQLAMATDYNAMVHIANQFMRRLIKKERKNKLLIDDVCAAMLQTDGNLNLKELAYSACLSTKQLERKFKERTGVNPKLFERIIRFDKAFRLKNSRPDLDWLRIAMECNYHDYQHMAKEYKDFTGLTPVAFHEIEGKAPERQFGLSEGYYK